MEDEERIQHKSSFETANLFSKIFFGWSMKLFAIGVKRELKLDDVSKVQKEEKADIAAERLQINWEKEVIRALEKKSSPNFIRAFFRSFLRESIICLSVQIIIEIISISQALLVGVIIRYFSSKDINGSVSASDARNAAILQCVSLFFFSLFRHNLYLYTHRLSIRLKTAISVLVFRKILKIKRTSEGTSIGQILNILTNDLSRFNELAWMFWFIIISPFEVVAVYVILWMYIGYSCLISLLVVLLFVVGQGFLSKYVKKFRFMTTQRTDVRVKLMSEIVNAMRVIKMYAWENAFADKIANMRLDEIKQLKKSMFVRTIVYTLSELVPKILLFVSLLSLLYFGSNLNAETMFVTMTLFNAIQFQIGFFIPMGIGYVAEAAVTLKRVKEVLMLEEKCNYTDSTLSVRPGTITLNNFSGRWNKESKGLSLKNINLKVDSGQLIIVVGPVGSGKTCLLMAILSEIEKDSGACVVSGTLSYTPQESWCFNGSVKQNIVFGREFNKEKYETIIDVCGLTKDLKMFAFGDETLIGEKGITLSGGQKARINLARAVYDDADIYLFDDPLSAVDSEVANHIFHKCIDGYLAKKTRILVTHNLQFLNRADKIAIMKDGQCLTSGTVEQIINSGIDLSSMIGKNKEDQSSKEMSFEIRNDKEDEDTSQSNTLRPVMSYDEYMESKEEAAFSGSVKFKVYLDYFKAGGNKFLLAAAISSALLSQILFHFIDYWLSVWSEYQDLRAANKTNFFTENLISSSQSDNVLGYSISIAVLVIGLGLRFGSNIVVCLKSSINLHNTIFHRLMRTPIAFFEHNPKGRILNRFTGDMGLLDQRIPISVLDVNWHVAKVIGIVLVNCAINPYLLVVVIILVLISLPLRRYYLRTVRNIKRYESITRSPVFNAVSTTFDGLNCIRAFRLEHKFDTQFQRYFNDNNACVFLLGALSRTFGFILDWCSVAFFVSITALIFFGNIKMNGAEIGLILSSTLVLMSEFQFCLRMVSEYETQMISAERVLEYGQLPSEAPLVIEKTKPPVNWPTQGTISFHHVYLRYSNSAKSILTDLCFNVVNGEKIGIVGRTGAGKSSIVNALFRLVEYEGLITIDGTDIKKLGLTDLRKKLSIIPQDPIMFQGTIRTNVDPYNEFSEDYIWQTLKSVKLESTFTSIPGGLYADVSENGSNLSVGQRQLICMVRSLLRKNRILIMDEATANIDHETDALIQTAIKECLKEITVLTIAHRLNTVIEMDKILVIDGGRIVEFDTPFVLLNKPNGRFKEMVTQLGDRCAALLNKIAEECHKKHGIVQ